MIISLYFSRSNKDGDDRAVSGESLSENLLLSWSATKSYWLFMDKSYKGPVYLFSISISHSSHNAVFVKQCDEM